MPNGRNIDVVLGVDIGTSSSEGDVSTEPTAVPPAFAGAAA